MDTNIDKRNDGSVLRAAVWTFALSFIGIYGVALGLFIAGAVGGAIAKRPAAALKAVMLPAIFWTGALIIASRTGVKVGGHQIWIPAILAVIPALAVIGGALMAAAGKPTRIVGLCMGILSGYVAYNELAPLYKTVAPLLAKQADTEQKNKETCPGNLKQLHKAILLYADSWDDTLPPADKWMDLIKENVPEDKMLRCPSVPASPGNFGYAMNSALGGKKWKEVKDGAQMPLFYDTSDLKPNAHDDYKSLPSPGRHSGHNNVIFLDGHVGER